MIVAHVMGLLIITVYHVEVVNLYGEITHVNLNVHKVISHKLLITQVAELFAQNATKAVKNVMVLLNLIVLNVKTINSYKIQLLVLTVPIIVLLAQALLFVRHVQMELIYKDNNVYQNALVLIIQILKLKLVNNVILFAKHVMDPTQIIVYLVNPLTIIINQKIPVKLTAQLDIIQLAHLLITLKVA